MYLEGDIILKQGYINSHLYYIHEGMAEVVLESQDFKFFDYKKVNKFINISNNMSEDDCSCEESSINSNIKNQGSTPNLNEIQNNKDLFQFRLKHPTSQSSGKVT